MTREVPYSSYNPYFILPFTLWVVVGGVLLIVFDQQTLFAFFNTHHSSIMDEVMYKITWMGEGTLSAIVLLSLFGMASLRNWWYAGLAIVCNIIPSLVITQLLKNAVDAPRPLNLFKGATWVHYEAIWPLLMEHSFPSGHTCAAFSLFALLAMLLKEKYQAWGIVFFILALLVGYSRMYLAAHFFLDVYVGSIIGTLFVILAIYVMRRYATPLIKE